MLGIMSGRLQNVRFDVEVSRPISFTVLISSVVHLYLFMLLIILFIMFT